MYGGFHIQVKSDRNLYVYPNAKIWLAFCERCNSEALIRYCNGRGKGLPVASLGTCRQIYHEAKNVLYSTNDFTFNDPRTVDVLIRRLDNVNHRSLSVRSLYLHVHVDNKNSERQWDNTFRMLAESLKNLRHIRIFVGEYIWNRYPYLPTRRQNPAQGKRPFLQGLLELKKLPLKTVELVMIKFMQDDSFRGDACTWTDSQKREWARKMEGAILSSR